MRLLAQSRTRVGASCVGALLALLATSGPAAAAPKVITGKLSKQGYTVIALAADGRATSVRAPRGAFRLRPRTERVTLHLRAPDGVYAGPVVIRGEGRRAILGVKSGARLGKINVLPGHARLARRLARKWVAAIFTARARGSVPIGAGRFGRVRSKPPRVAVRGDRDRDGIPNSLDIDDDGDLVLDNQDRSTAARASQLDESVPPDYVKAELPLGIQDTVNANAGVFSDQQMEAALPREGRLLIGIQSGDSAELDCGVRPRPGGPPRGLVYCSSGGTGQLFTAGCCPPRSTWPRFPDDFDPDRDGLGNLIPYPQGGTALFLSHGATTAQIGTGDVLIQRVTAGDPPVEREYATALQYVFATVPALVSYGDGRGNSATVSYPVPGHMPGPPGPGTRENGFPVRGAGPNGDGDVVLTLTFWRPQRRPIAGEQCLLDTPPCAWVDIGGLTYGAGIADTGGSQCPPAAFSTTDPSLTPAPSSYVELIAGGLTDLAADRVASPANTFTYTVNLTRCLPSPWNPGETRLFDFYGSGCGGNDCIHGLSGGPDRTGQQAVSFKRQ